MGTRPAQASLFCLLKSFASCVFILKMRPRIRHTQGFSLIEVLVSVAVMGVISFAMMEMIQQQNKSIRILSEKLAVKDLEISLKSLVSNNNFCGCLFKNINFDVAGKKLSNKLASIPDGFGTTGACNATTSLLIPPVGQKIGSSQMEIAAIEVVDVVDQGNGNYTAKLSVEIAPSSLVMPLQPAVTPIAFNIDTATGKINGCGAVNSGNILFGGMYDQCTQPGIRCTPNPVTKAYSCPPGFRAERMSSFDDRGKFMHHLIFCITIP